MTEAGARRAQALARVAADAGVSAVYSTQFKRNRDTVRPLAERLGIVATEVPADPQPPGGYGERLARQIIEKHPGQTVVVVGHANTISSVVEGLTGRAASPGDIAYSDLFIINHSSGLAGVIRARYGLCAE